MKKFILIILSFLLAITALWTIKGKYTTTSNGIRHYHIATKSIAFFSTLGDNVSFYDNVILNSYDMCKSVGNKFSTPNFIQNLTGVFIALGVPLQFIYNTLAWSCNIIISITKFYFSAEIASYTQLVSYWSIN